MKTYNYYGNKITMKKAAPEWFNYDCPEIYAEDGTLIVKNTLYGFVWDEWETHLKRQQIAKFVKASYKAACKKYGWDFKKDWSNADALFAV